MESTNITLGILIFTIFLSIFCTWIKFTGCGNITENNIAISDGFAINENIEANTIKDTEVLIEQLNIYNEMKENLIINPSTTISKYQTFYNVTIFPQLNLINKIPIHKEINDYIATTNKWKDWGEYELWKGINPNASWTVLPLMAFGKWSQTNTKLFPKTTRELEKINELGLGLVSAGFSKLGPGTQLSYHQGWGALSNMVLRCHLGLIVPESKCKVFVIGKNSNKNTTNNLRKDSMIQEKDKWIVFDDSLTHSASNDSGKANDDRIILLIDIMRPSNVAKGESNVIVSEELNNFVNEFNS